MSVRASLVAAVGTGAVIALIAGTGGPAASVSTASGHDGIARHAVLKPEKWTRLGAKYKVTGASPTVWQNANGTSYLLWGREVGTLFTYEVASISSAGKVSAPDDIFAGAHWGGLSTTPSLVAAGTKPLVVYTGGRGSSGPYSLGCIYGAEGGAKKWALQTWSLSNDCVNPVGAASEDKQGVIAAAWPGGWAGGQGTLYRIGTSPTIPATGSDKHIGIKTGTSYQAGVAADTTGNGDFYVAWAQANSNAKDGFYAKDVTANGSAEKMPGTSTNSVIGSHLVGNLAITNTTSHSGVYLAGCGGKTRCQVEVWKIGAKKAIRVPSSSNVSNVEISQGPGGRIWLATFDESSYKVTVRRSNKKVTKFGPGETFSAPCFGAGLALSGGSESRLVIGMRCTTVSTGTAAVYVTETSAPLSLSAKPSKVQKGHSVTFTVTDAGDPVKGAVVTFEGHHATTDAKGKASLKASSKGKAVAVATAKGYLTARHKVTVV